MLVNIALTAATGCTARACTKRIDETQWPETWNETEPRPQHIAPRPRRDISTSQDRLETEMSRPRPHPWLWISSSLSMSLKKI